MHAYSILRSVRVMATIASVLLGGCAINLKPVADFSAATTVLTDSYRPMVTGISSVCETRQIYKNLEETGPYDSDALAVLAKADCKPLVEAGKSATEFADVVAGYAGALASLAGTKSTVFDDDIDGVSKALTDLKVKDGTAIFDKDKISAASKLASAVVDILVQHKVNKLTRSIVADNQQALRTVVEAMKTFVSDNYRGELKNTRGFIDSVAKRAVEMSTIAPVSADNPMCRALGAEACKANNAWARIPVRFAQVSIKADLAANKAEEEKIDKFVLACDALVKAHAQLLEQFDQLSTVDRLQAVSDFVGKVKAIRDSARAL